MFERMTERARQVVVLAQDEARNMKHQHLGTEHLLLGLLREGEGLAARTLESLDVTTEEVRGHVRRIVGDGEFSLDGQIPLTPRAKKVLEMALREALSLGHNYIGTEHVLLGLVRENEGVGARILLDFDAGAEKVRNSILGMLMGPTRSHAWSRTDVQLQQLITRDRDVFRVVAIADEPTVIVENVSTKAREHHVITSLNFSKFSLLKPLRDDR